MEFVGINVESAEQCYMAQEDLLPLDSLDEDSLDESSENSHGSKTIDSSSDSTNENADIENDAAILQTKMVVGIRRNTIVIISVSIICIILILIFALFYCIHSKMKRMNRIWPIAEVYLNAGQAQQQQAQPHAKIYTQQEKIELFNKHYKLMNFTINLSKFDQNDCLICLVEFEVQEEIRKIGPCKHIFHEVC